MTLTLLKSPGSLILCHAMMRLQFTHVRSFATDWLYAPYQNLVLSSGVWWSLLPVRVVCDATTRRHIQVCKPTLWRSLFIQHAYFSTRTLLTRCCTMCHCNEYQLSVLQVRRRNQNTFNAKTEQFITAKISGNALKQGSRTQSVLRPRISQLQKRKAEH